MKKIIGLMILLICTLLIYQTIKLDNNDNNDNVYFAFYNGEEKLDTMPLKNNPEDLVFSHANCDNNAYIEWDNNEWAPLVKNLTKNKTKCSLYFKKYSGIDFIKNNQIITSGDGLYVVAHDVTETNKAWNQKEYRYAGTNPNNYVKFNNEIWRIIGVVNVKTDNGIEQRLKIVRTDAIEGQNNFGSYAWDTKQNNWIISTLKDMLNGIYYESGVGECYTGDANTKAIHTTCDFNSGTNLPKGLDETARNMIDEDVIWNIGGWQNGKITANQFYEKERGTNKYNDYQVEWSKETDIGEKYNGIGLIYPSDYGYAVGGEVRNNCLTKILYDYDQDNCGTNDWLKQRNNLLTILSISTNSTTTIYVNWSGRVHGYDINYAVGVWPTLYLKSTVNILPNPKYEQEYGTIDNPFILQ